jgi:A/G-specific adenine glycosylase
LKPETIVPLLLRWFARHARDLPWRRTRDPYAIWVSEIMLQQTQVKTVMPYWSRWMKELPTLQTLARATPAKIHKLWEGLGYYTRVRNMQKAARLILARHGGEFPTDFDQVLELPGIGRYTAGAVCSIAFNQPRPILDGNVIRVLTRVFGIDGDPKEKAVNARLWGLAGQLVTEAHRLGRARGRDDAINRHPGESFLCSQLNQSLMELGALVCTPRTPRCADCPLARRCFARKHARTEELPRLTPRQPPTRRRFVAFVVEQHGRFLVQQRPADVVNAHLWEFPNVEIAPDESNPSAAGGTALGFTPAATHQLCSLRHSITRYRIQLDVFRAAPNRLPASNHPGSWFAKSDLHRLPFTSAHKKVLAGL